MPGLFHSLPTQPPSLEAMTVGVQFIARSGDVKMHKALLACLQELTWRWWVHQRGLILTLDLSVCHAAFGEDVQVEFQLTMERKEGVEFEH